MQKYKCPYCGDECEPFDGYFDDEGDEVTEWICEGKCGAYWCSYGDDPVDERICWRGPRAEEDWVTS